LTVVIDSCGFFLNTTKLDFQDLRPIKLLLLFSRFCSNYIAEYRIRYVISAIFMVYRNDDNRRQSATV